MLVARQAEATVTVVSTATHQITATIPTDPKPQGVAVDEQDGMAFVTHWQSNRISEVNLANSSVEGRLTLKQGTNGIAIDPLSRSLWVTNWDDGTVSVVDFASRKTSMQPFRRLPRQAV